MSERDLRRVIRVLLADDHPVVRDGYRRLLESEPDLMVVAEAGDADATYLEFVRHQPDVLVLDLSMPGGGLDALRRILAREPAAKVLVFTMHDSEMMVRRVREAGALGYLAKHGSSDQLLAAIRRVARGDPYPSCSGDIERDPDVAGGNPAAALSPREFQIFLLIAEGHSLGDIAAALHISPKTANVHHANIMRKLGTRNDAQLVRLAFQYQLVS